MVDALLIIDVQRAFFDAEPRPWEADRVVERINVLSARARAARVPVVVIQHESKADGVLHGSQAWQLPAGLRVADADLRVRKVSPDSFHQTDLQALLEARGVRRVVACGYATEFCVDTTVRRAAALGFEVCIASDAHTTHDKAHLSGAQIRTHHNATLPDIGSFGVVITAVPSAEIDFR